MTGPGRGWRLSEMACHGHTPCLLPGSSPKASRGGLCSLTGPTHRCSWTLLLLKGLGLTDSGLRGSPYPDMAWSPPAASAQVPGLLAVP